MNENAQSKPTPPVVRQERFHVVCVAENGSFFRLNLEAPTAEAAAATAREQGHVVAMTYVDGLARADQNRILSVLRRNGTNCPACGYSLEGLASKNGVVICPECGFGDPVEENRKREAKAAPPGRMLVHGGVFFAALEALSLRHVPSWPVLGVVGLILAIVGFERSRGEYGGRVIYGVALIVAVAVIRMLL